MIETIELPIQGMTCASCVNRITQALRKLDGVERVRVDLVRETATIRRDSALVSKAALATAVAAAGYEADVAAAVPITRLDRPGFAARFVGRLRS